MVINFLGDSITEGAGAEKVENMYTTLVGKMLNVKVNNYGICGTRIARQIVPTPQSEFEEYFLLRAKKMDKNADLVFVFGGTNDYGHGDALMGEFNTDDKNTFYGGLKELIEYLISVYGKEKICFILPLLRFDEDSPYGENHYKAKAYYPLSAYRTAIKKTCDYYGIECLDFRDIFPMPVSNKGDEFTMDGLHPNPKGHYLLAERICNYIKSKYKIQ